VFVVKCLFAEFLFFNVAKASAQGGAMLLLDSVKVTLKSCNFYLNNSTADGGAVYLQGHEVVSVSQCSFEENWVRCCFSFVRVFLELLLLVFCFCF